MARLNTARTTRTASTATIANAPPRSKTSRSQQPPEAPDRDNSSGDDSDAMHVTSKKPGITRTRNTHRGMGAKQKEVQVRPKDLMMTGGLGDGDLKGAHKANGKTRPRKMAKRDGGQAKALDALKRRRDEARSREKEEGRKSDVEESSPAVQRVVNESPMSRNGQRVARTSNSSPAVRTSSPHRPVPPSSAVKPPPSAVKAQGTPLVESSILALSKFKRRPRQPSLLRMMQQTSDIENNDSLNDDSNLTLNYSLGDFEPDHESTPLNLNKNTARPGIASGSEPRTSSSRKRKLSLEPEPEVQVPASSPPIAERESSSEHLYSEASDLPQLVADTQEQYEEEAARDATPEIFSETMAPPKSTSSSLNRHDDDVMVIPAKRQRRQPLRNLRNHHTEADPESSDASQTETETPVRPKKPAAKSKKTKAPSLSTAALQSLLPRRRKTTIRTNIDPFEIPSSDEIDVTALDSNEDELQHQPAARRNTVASRKSLPADTTVRKKRGRPAQTSAAAAAAAAAKAKGKAKRPSKTYGRQRLSSDKENENADDDREGEDDDFDGQGEEDTSEVVELRKNKELTKAAKKFAEIDEWEMEFESVDMGGNSASSPWR